MRETRLALWLSGTALAVAMVLTVFIWHSQPHVQPCPGCEAEREVIAFQQKLKALERDDLCPECLVDWD